MMQGATWGGTPTFRQGFQRLLLVVKHTPYELKAQGKAPLALRWERLKNRHDIHLECVETVKAVLMKHKVAFSAVGREELDRQHISKVDLVIAVGGDGTVLSASHFLGSNIPLVGVNSDPNRPGESSGTKRTDERRSFGALCMCTSADVEEELPKVLLREVEPQMRTRVQTSIKSTFTETRLPPALNDVLIAHPSPAAVSRFRLGFSRSDEPCGSSFIKDSEDGHMKKPSRFNVWSSGIWISTATGSTAAMKAAGGGGMHPFSGDMQYMVREHLVEKDMEHLRAYSQGIVPQGSKIHIRWGSQHGFVYIDGEHSRHPLSLGDELEISGDAPPLYLYSQGSS